MPTVEPGEVLCPQIWIHVDGLVVKLTLHDFHTDSTVTRTVKGSVRVSKSRTNKYSSIKYSPSAVLS